MYALTICQPYPFFIVADPAELAAIRVPGSYRAFRPKRVENRPWSTKYRGDLLIHAGANRDWLGSFKVLDDAGLLHFSALLGVARVVDSFVLDRRPGWREAYPWLESNMHFAGPGCILLDDVRRFREPIPCKGKQGLWRIDETEPTLRAALADAIPVLWKFGE